MSFENYQEVKPTSNYIKFNKVNDYIEGTLIGVFTPNKPDNFGKMDKKYTILCDEGSVHLGKMDAAGNYVVDATPTVLTKDEEYIVTGKASVDRAMKEIQIGQKCVIQLSEFKASSKPGYKPSKIMRIMGGAMNQVWIDANKEALKDVNF